MFLTFLGLFIFFYPQNSPAFELREQKAFINFCGSKHDFVAEEIDKGMVQYINAAIQLYYTKTLVENLEGEYPLSLDEAEEGVCIEDNPCFDIVLLDPVHRCWEKISDIFYESLHTNQLYYYSSVTGVFEEFIVEGYGGVE